MSATDAWRDDPIPRFLIRWILLGLASFGLAAGVEVARHTLDLDVLGDAATTVGLLLWQYVETRLPEALAWLLVVPWLIALVIALLDDLGVVPRLARRPSRRALAARLDALHARIATTEAAAMQAARGVFERLEVGALRVCDGSGRLRAIVGCDDDETLLGLTDARGGVRATLHVDRDGVPRLALYDAEERARLELSVIGDEPRIVTRTAGLDGRGASQPPGYL